jgi:hypothetical protein
MTLETTLEVKVSGGEWARCVRHSRLLYFRRRRNFKELHLEIEPHHLPVNTVRILQPCYRDRQYERADTSPSG